MKHYRVLIIVFLSLFCFSVFAQSKILRSQEMKSELLNTTVKYTVYLPDGFDTKNAKYPVVYLLNGFTGDETNWVQVGQLKNIADKLIKGHKIKPMVIIMPDGDDRLYMNRDDGTYPYEDMFIKELMPYVESAYHINSDKESRGISGLSMGGAGSLRLALKYNDIFGSCAAFSSAIFTPEEVVNFNQRNFDNYVGRMSPSSVGLEGEARLNDAYNDYDVLQWVKTKEQEQLNSVAIYFDCGDDDFLTLGNSQLHIEMIKRRIPHEYRVRDGGHTWNFWVESLPVGLEFISNHMGLN